VPAVAVVDVQVNSQSAVRSLERVNNASKQAQTSVNGLVGIIGKLAGSFAAISAARFVFAKTAEIETQTKSLQVLTGSVQQAKQIIEELQQLGAVTPFTSTELIDAAKRLQAFGVEGSRVVEVTRRLADASGATGAELQGLVTAYGQVVAKGRLQGEELLQFQERGVGVQQELQKMYNLSGEELQKALSKGQISAKAVEVAFQRLTSAGGKYANGAVAQSDTLSGKLSTLQDGIDALARRLGQVLTPALKAIFSQAIAVVDAINQALAAGRGGGFTKSVFGARQALNVGATGQAVDKIAQGIGQISSQKNRSGIQQNLQALQQYQRLLQSIAPSDPNSDRAVQLQGVILRKIDQNINAQKLLNKETDKAEDIFKTPALGAGTGGAGRTKKAKKGPESQLSAIEAANGLYRSQQMIVERIAIAEFEGNRAEVLRLQHIERGVQLMHDAAAVQRDQTIPLMDREAQLRGISDKLMGSSSQYARELAQYMREQVESLPGYLDKLVSMASGYSSVLDFSKRLTEEQQRQKELADGIGNSVGQGMVGAFDALILGADNFNSALQNIASGVLTDIARQLLQVFVIQQAINAISGIFAPKTGGLAPGVKFMPSAFSMPNLMARAGGGSVMAGQGYLVGEKGPELFMPGRSGGIAPTGTFGGVQVGSVNITVQNTGENLSPAAQKQIANQVQGIVMATLVNQKRSGGIL